MSYDGAGNVTYDNYTGQGQEHRVYDAENRMTQAWGNNQWQTYAYDARGQRVTTKVDGVETWMVYGIDGELVAEYAGGAGASSPQKEYGYRNGQLLITAGPAGSQNPPQTYKASTDFSAEQGHQRWSYMDSNGTPLTFLTQWGGVWNLPPETSVWFPSVPLIAGARF